ncbi:MAG: phosphatase family protein [Candidatus Kaiserbacteria bacterium]|nr:phosphatase family protein [Candidatus Kaiserbacteria bacterium]
MDLLIIFAAKYLIILPVLVALYLIYKLPAEDRLSYGIHVIATGILAYVLAKVLGHFYFDARPFVSDGIVPLIPHAADNGFPSDHTLLASVLAAVVFIFNKNIGVALWIIALLIGAARVAAGIHHPLDIAGSIVISIIAAIIVALSLKKKTTF